VTFRVPRAVLTLTVWLIDRLTVDAGPGPTRTVVMRIDIVDVDEQAGMRDGSGQRRLELILRSDLVQPDGRIARADFAVDGLTIGSPMEAARRDPNARTRKSCAAAMSW
jgi:hypothetical protein